jgi:hypothetical protein
MIEIISKGIESMPAKIPEEWDVQTVLQLDDGPLTLTFKNGMASLAKGDIPEPESIIKLSNLRVCNIVDGSIDYMMVWRELAEPSPTDRTYILKGSGAKFFTLIDGLIKCYKSNPEFKKSIDDFKASLT